MVHDISSPWIIVIHTEQYSGNFERQLCAFLTGQTGQCGVGQEIANEVQSEIQFLDWWQKHIVLCWDEKKICKRPVSTWPNPKWFNNGFGKYYPNDPFYDQKALDEAIASFKESRKSQITMIQKRLEQQQFETEPYGFTQQNCEKTLFHYEQELQKIQTLTKYPAYLSVAIFVDEKPSKAVLNELKKRALFFAKEPCFSSNPIFISGFELIENVPTPLKPKPKIR